MIMDKSEKQYDKFLQDKVGRARESLKSGHGKSNHQIESEFSRRRSVFHGEADKQ